MTAPARRRPVFGRRRAVVAALVAVVSIGGTSVASAADPRPDSPAGATAVVDPVTVVQGGTLTFRGTGFQTAGKGEIVSIKIDDNAILLGDALKSNTWGLFTAASDGTLAGSLDLSKAHSDTPILPGAHWIRLLTGTSQPGDTTRTLHATFTVVAPTPTTPADSGTPPSTPAPGTPITPAAPTTPVATTPEIVRTGPVWLTATTTKPSATKLTLKLKAGALGSAGKVSVRSKDKFKIGKGKAKTWVVARSDAYFVDKLEATTVRLRLTPEGKTLIKRKKVLKLVVTLADANGEDTVRQEIWATR